MAQMKQRVLVAFAACTAAAAQAARPGERLIFADEFDTLDLMHKWKPEISMSGYGSWSFEVYQNNRTNLFTRNGVLYLKPTLMTDVLTLAQIQNGYTFDIRGTDPASLCTGDQYWGCMRTSGAGGNVLNPVRSARIRTAETFNFRYGRVEVRAKLPRGDWLWPAIWLLPRHAAYGAWPASGEIDIVESRGNGPDYPPGGVNWFTSTLHAGPYTTANLYQQMHAEYFSAAPLSDSFHVYGLIWRPTGITTYIDDPANVVLNVAFDRPMYQRGGFTPATTANPWESSTNPNVAPFDQEFYLICNVAVGGTGGFFPDGYGKPWTNLGGQALNSVRKPLAVLCVPKRALLAGCVLWLVFVQFWNARAQWGATWVGDNSALQIDWIRVYQFEDSSIPSSVSGDYFLNVTAAGLASMPTPRPQEQGNPQLQGLSTTAMTGARAVGDACAAQQLNLHLTLNVTRNGSVVANFQ